MIEDHQERRPAVGDGLDSGAGDDLAAEDLPVGGDPLRSDAQGEAPGGGDISGGSLREPAAPRQEDEFGGQQNDEQPEQQRGQETSAEAAGIGAGDDGRDASHEPIVLSRRRAAWLAAAALAVIVAVLAIVISARGEGPQKRQTEVTRTAARFALALSSYDYRHLDRDLTKVRTMGVGNFGYQYQQILGGNSFETALGDNKSVATAKITGGPFVAALGHDDARTFTVLSQTIKTESAPDGETRRVRLESTLVRTSNGWRVDWVEIT